TLPLDPPSLSGLVVFEGGGGFVYELSGCSPEEVNVGMPLTMNFRKKFDDNLRGIKGYFWKAIPAE
ncbi:MAG: 3-hydroxy-3-methylglutaryl CoA synthase, partial [Syntrophales bacterium LBB04]|nr:3-hydroxy-3-methylglutaryl CoA synthase [Syntrophales bacterium LBB04]